VLGAPRGIAEDVAGRGDLLETLLGFGVPRIRVGVELLGEFLERARQVFVGRARRHAEDRVVVLLQPLALRCHSGFFLVTFTIAGRSTRPFNFQPVRNTSSTCGSPSPSSCNTASCSFGSNGASSASMRSRPARSITAISSA